MGFRKDAYATVWSVEQKSNTLTNGRISISRKNKNTGEYETDFSGFVSFIGTAAAQKASHLKERDRIRIGDVDVTNKDEIDGASAGAQIPDTIIDDGEIDDSDLPF